MVFEDDSIACRHQPYRCIINTAQEETTPLKVDRVTLKRYVMWYIALHILLDNLFLHILTPHHDRPNVNLVMLY